MRENKRTPGPWQVESDYSSHGSDRIVMANQCYVIADTRHPYCAVAEQAANARLIAAAPELLAACIAVVRADDCHRTLDAIEAVRSARAAIAKATGV